ncbi:MAG: nuclear transport factor 2 family protein [Planctomycetes bacterium]|nr:nuclear transport factor 2 family protein [Planctomycetota bacterium]
MSRATIIVAVLALAAAVAGGCESAPKVKDTPTAVPEDVLREEVLGEVNRYYEDLSARNWIRFADHFWPRATMTTIWQPPGENTMRVYTSSVAEFVARAPEGPGSKPIFEETLLSADVRVVDSLAHVWARYHARFGDPDNIVEWTGIDAITLMKHQGRWRIVSMAYAPQ